MKKRAFLVPALAAGLAALSAGGSLAYFTSFQKAPDRFLVAGSGGQDPDSLFSIEVVESKIDPATGKPVPGGVTTKEGNTYENVVPGSVLIKDPSVRNTGAYGQYVRAKVTLTGARAWERAREAHRGEKNGLDDIGRIFGGLDTVNWTVSGDSPVLDEGADELTWTFYYNRVLAGGESAGLFQNIVIPECLDSGDMAALSGFRIRIRAEAVQSDYTSDSAPGAFGLLE